MARKDANQDKFLQSLGESFDAMGEAIGTETRRGIRFSKRLVQEIGQGRKELTALGRRFGRSPTDVGDLYEASVDLARRSGSHSSALAQELLAGARAAGVDVRSTTGTVIRANRSATAALTAAVRGAAADAARLAQRKPRPAKRVAGPAAPKGRPVKAAARRRAPRRKPAAPKPSA
jgi:hypothetical protein